MHLFQLAGEVLQKLLIHAARTRYLHASLTNPLEPVIDLVVNGTALPGDAAMALFDD